MNEFTENPYIIRSLYILPDEEPVVKYLNGTEAQMEELVHGKIASAGIEEGVCVIHNALSELLKMTENRVIDGTQFYGPMIVVSFDNVGNIISLTEDDAEYFAEQFALKKPSTGSDHSPCAGQGQDILRFCLA